MTPAQADVYRWVAADGTVNYGEREPRGRDFTVISKNGAEKTKTVQTRPTSAFKRSSDNQAQTATATPNAVPADGENLSDHQKAMLDRMKADEAKRKENLAELRRSNCSTSKRVLSQMQSRGRIRVRNDDGEESALSDQDRSERIRKAQESIAVNCDSLS